MPQAQNKQNIKENSSQRALTHLSLNCSDSTRSPKAEEVGSWEQGPTGESWEFSISCQLPLMPSLPCHSSATDVCHTLTLLTH